MSINLPGYIVIAKLKYFFYYRFSFIHDLIKDNQSYIYLDQNSHFIGLYLYENLCKKLDNQENCIEEPSKLRLGFLQNIILLFFSVLGYRYLKMISIFKNLIAKRTQNYLIKILNKTNENQNNDENQEFNINISSILNDPQEIDDQEIAQDFVEGIKNIVVNFLNISIVDEMFFYKLIIK